MIKKLFKKETIIGLCAILAIIILIFGIDYLKGINLFHPANYYYVSYTDVNGLSVSAPVTINGYKVGQVRAMEYEYDNPGHILVELSLNKSLKIPKGTKAIIKSDLLGTATIHLDIPDNTDWHDIGSKIIGETDKGMLAGMGESLLPTVENIMPKVDSLLTSLNRIAADPALMASVKRLDAITSNLESTMRSINASVAKLPSTMNNVNGVAANFEVISSNLASVSGELKNLPIQPIMNDLQATTSNLKRITQELDSPNSTLGLLMHDRALYDNINNTIVSLDSLFTDIKRQPKRYISIKLL
ncbi:MAG: MCE family protein [Muribaculaceae bacterium]|nr:MCE family protein [Muribaculaceae bacterium]